MHRSHSTFIHVALSSGHCFVAYRENEHSLLNRSRIYYAKLILCASTIKVMLNCYQAISVVPYKTTSPASICLYTVRAPVFPEFADKTCLYRKFFNICIWHRVSNLDSKILYATRPSSLRIKIINLRQWTQISVKLSKMFSCFGQQAMCELLRLHLLLILMLIVRPLMFKNNKTCGFISITWVWFVHCLHIEWFLKKFVLTFLVVERIFSRLDQVSLGMVTSAIKT